MKNLALVAVAIGFLLRLVKDPDLMARLGLPALPKKWIAPAAVLLGVLSVLVEGLAQGLPPLEALTQAIAGAFAGAGAIAGHQVLVEGLRGGKELGK